MSTKETGDDDQRARDVAAILRKYLPNAGDDTWTGGPAPVPDGDPRPDDGVPVVYRLWEDVDDDTPGYVGSTVAFGARLRSHARRFAIVRWQADRHPTIDAAKAHEGELIRTLTPRLNRTTGGIHYSRADWERDQRERDRRRAANPWRDAEAVAS